MESIVDASPKERAAGWRVERYGRKDQLLVNQAFDKRRPQFREVFGMNLEMD
jgi:hypothetical protein